MKKAREVWYGCMGGSHVHVIRTTDLTNQAIAEKSVKEHARRHPQCKAKALRIALTVRGLVAPRALTVTMFTKEEMAEMQKARELAQRAKRAALGLDVTPLFLDAMSAIGTPELVTA